MRLFIAFAATLLLASCQFFPFLNQPSESSPPTDVTWHKGTLTIDAPTKTFTFPVTPGETYYLNWEDTFEQGSPGKFTADIQVTANWDADYSAPVSQVDSGWCGPQSYSGTEPGGAVDHTQTLVVPTDQVVTTVTILVERFPEGSLGTFQVRWAKTPLPGYGQVVTSPAGASQPSSGASQK